MRDVGKMGERAFAMLCSEVGITENPSTVDRTGWDYHLEFPLENNSSSLQLHHSPIECRVQIKSTDKSRKSEAITVSNLYRLVTSLVPTFFVFLEFDGMSQIQRMYLVHPDESLIYRVLNKVQSLRNSETCKKLNKSTITVNYDESHRIFEPFADGLVEGVMLHTSGGMEGYIDKKKKFLQKCGFEKGYGTITLTFEDGDSTLQNLIDLSLGLGSGVPVMASEARLSRFGIEDKEKLFDVKDGHITRFGAVPIKEGVVKFRENPYTAPLTFNFQLYASHFNKYVPHDEQKLRLACDYFSLVLTGSERKSACTLQLEIKYEQRIELTKFIRVCKLFDLLNKSMETNISAELLYEPEGMFKFNLMKPESPIKIADSLYVLNKLNFIIDYFRFSDEISISLELIKKNYKEINGLYNILNKEKFSVELETQAVVEILGEEVNNKKWFYIGFGMAQIGEYIFGVVFCAESDLIMVKGDVTEVTYSEITVKEKIIGNPNDPSLFAHVRSKIAEEESRYNDSHTVFTNFSSFSE